MKRMPTKLAKRIEVLEQRKTRKAVPSGLAHFYGECNCEEDCRACVIGRLAHFYGGSEQSSKV